MTEPLRRFLSPTLPGTLPQSLSIVPLILAIASFKGMEELL